MPSIIVKDMAYGHFDNDTAKRKRIIIIIVSLLLLSLVFIYKTRHGAIRPECSYAEKKGSSFVKVRTMPVNFAIIGDSRMYDFQYKSFGGFSNYIKFNIAAYPLFSKTVFVFEDDNPYTSSNYEGSDYYCSISCRPKQAFANFARVVEKNHDGVIFNLGVNNGGEVALSIECFKKMFAVAKGKNMFVVAMTIHPWKGYETWCEFNQYGTDEINRWLLSKPENIDVVINTYALLEDPKNPGRMRLEYTTDWLHLTPLGHKLIADELNRAVTAYFNGKNAGM